MSADVHVQVAGACSCERNWSTYDYIHNKKRNRLSASRCRDLVYVFSNRRLLDGVQDLEYEQQFVDWQFEEDEEEEEACGRVAVAE